MRNAADIYRLQPPSLYAAQNYWNRIEHRALEGFVLAIAPFNFCALGANLSGIPALMGNTCSTFLVTYARLAHAPSPDEEEDITVELVPLAEIPAWIARGDITHAMVVAAFWYLLAHTGKPALPGLGEID